MAKPRTTSKRNGKPANPIMVGVRLIVAIGVLFGLLQILGGGLKVDAPGWFDNTRTNIEQGVDDNRRRVEDEIGKHVPTQFLPTTSPADRTTDQNEGQAR